MRSARWHVPSVCATACAHYTNNESGGKIRAQLRTIRPLTAQCHLVLTNSLGDLPA